MEVRMSRDNPGSIGLFVWRGNRRVSIRLKAGDELWFSVQDQTVSFHRSELKRKIYFSNLSNGDDKIIWQAEDAILFIRVLEACLGLSGHLYTDGSSLDFTYRRYRLE